MSLPAAELAEQCYEAARGAEPTLVSVWEGMAATAAASGSPAGAAAAAAAAEHAVGLGGGPESWLAYATGDATMRPGSTCYCARLVGSVTCLCTVMETAG